MEPWQVWSVDTGVDDGAQLMLIVSTTFHLRINGGRLCFAAPITGGPQELLYQAPIKHPSDGETFWVHTDRMQLVTVPMSPTGWSLNADEIDGVRATLRHMIDL